MARFYECVRDLQGGSFGVGRIGTPNYWKKVAIDWCDLDDAYEYKDFIKTLYGNDVIFEVSSNWDLDIVPVKALEVRCPKCHKKMFKSNADEYAYQCVYCDEDFYEFEVKGEE